MVKINFKLIEPGMVELELDCPTSWEEVFSRCVQDSGLRTKSVLAIRRGAVLRPDDRIEDGDQIEVFPALSGG
ncbi:MoaD/ThiS family protein [Desulforhopalus singaporensis]|nr:MoaD/ThiS family protein [Desulforhopalus singaporensis]